MQTNALMTSDADQATDDLGPLAWVLDELKKSLDGATKAMRRFVRDAELARGSELAELDASQLRIARQQLHQAVGALEMVGFTAPAKVMRAMEALAQKFVQRPELCSDDAAAKMERASFALTEYLEGVLKGKSASPVALFPQYRDVMDLVGNERVHPADLWSIDWTWIDAPVPAHITPLAYGPAIRGRLDNSVLQFVKTGSPASAKSLRDVTVGLAVAQSSLEPRVFWKIYAAFFEAAATGLLASDVFVKRAASRVLMQYASLAKGDPAVSDRLAQDILFFCAQASPARPDDAPILTAVREAYKLTRTKSFDYETPQFGRFDPAVLAQARKRIATATETWSALAGGDTNRLKVVADQFNSVSDSITKLHPESGDLARALGRAVDSTVRSGEAPSMPVAMEVATSVLYLEAAYEDLDPTESQMAQRSVRLAQRLEHVTAGGQSEPLEGWMEELYRRVSDRQTMGSVVDELRSSLGDVEKSLDQFFRSPQDKTPLHEVPSKLAQMRGVFSVLGLDQASVATLRMRDSVEKFLVDDVVEGASEGGVFEKLGNSLGALGFLIDMLSYQRALAKKMFVYDDLAGEFKPVMGREKAAAPAPAPVPAPAPAPKPAGEIQALQELTLPTVAAQPLPAVPAATDSAFDRTMSTAAASALAGAGAVAAIALATPVAPAVVTAPVAELDEDEAEIREIFLDEAREVVQNGLSAVKALAIDPTNLADQTTLRRAFHTLKGSSRMVGLNEFGEAGWAMEQLMNSWLADQKPASDELIMLCGKAMAGLGRWVEDIDVRNDASWSAAPFRHAADAMRLDRKLVILNLPGSLDEPGSSPLVAPAGMLAPVAPTPAPAPPIPTLPMALAAEHPIEPIDSLMPQALTEPRDAQATVASKHAVEFASTHMFESDSTQIGDVREDAGHAAAAPQTLVDGPAEQTIVLMDLDFAPLPIQPPLEPQVPHEAHEAHVGHPEVHEGHSSHEGHDDFGDDDGPETQPGGLEPLETKAVQNLPPDLLDLPDLAEPSKPVALDSARMPLAVPAVAAATLAAVASLNAPSAAAPLAPTVAEEPLESVKVIGSLRIAIPLYNVFLNEADEWSRRLLTELNEWSLELHRPLPDSTIALAHSLSGSSATVGFTALSDIARALEQAMQHVQLHGRSEPAHAQAFSVAAEDIRRLLHQFAAGFLKEPEPQVLVDLKAILETDFGSSASGVIDDLDFVPSVVEADVPEAMNTLIGLADGSLDLTSELPAAAALPVRDASGFSDSQQTVTALPAATLMLAPATRLVDDHDDDIDLVDALDADLFPIFEEEALELMPQLGSALRQWSARPDNTSARNEVLRVLHTLKGSARLAGAMRLGEMAHRMESAIEQIGIDDVQTAQLEPLLTRFDAISANFDALRAGPEQAMVLPEASKDAAALGATASALGAAAGVAAGLAVVATTGAAAGTSESPAIAAPATIRKSTATTGLAPLRQIANQSVRVRSNLLDRLVNQAGEVIITRTRLESRLGQLRGSLGDLSSNLDRLRHQLRDIEVQSESQMQSRLALAKDSAQDFDPLEFDRFTRVQELTRMMAESVNDVATIQRTLQRSVEGTEDDLIAQARQARELQRDLLRTRMVEFEGISERLYGVVRQASKDAGKQVKLDITGGSMDIDRGVLERMAPAFEHLLRNAVAHGIEEPAARVAAGKPAAGTIKIDLQQQSNELSVEFNDDGAGLDLKRIRDKAVATGLAPDAHSLSDADTASLIFQAGFTTASSVTELSGRGIGMDVVRSEVNALGGRIETTTTQGQGTRFKLVLPLTTAVTQVVMLRLGELVIGVPANVIDIVRRVPAAEVAQAYQSGTLTYSGEPVAFFWAGALLQASAHSTETVGKNLPVAIFRSAGQRVAVHVDEVLGNQEVVVKNLGPQLARLPGLTGMSVLASGAVVLIYNPVALAAVYGEPAKALQHSARGGSQSATTDVATAQPVAASMSQVPLVMVVDDSITVRRVTQRLLKREGYRVVMAADGLQALERLQDEKPAVVLSDIEMPRMDGFDLARNIRATPSLRDLPIIMITSRIAEKHREHARELGVDHYLGKPYSEDELLGLVRHYCASTADV